MPLLTYDRDTAVEYAHKWALSRNPAYYDYSKIGGDCTNFASQCLYAGGGLMNNAPTFGWYYIGPSSHSPSWTGVTFLYNYLVRRTGVGPVGREVPMDEVQPGDLSQFAGGMPRFSHTQVIVSVGDPPSLEDILICTHTYDSRNRPLSSYTFQKIRFIHIAGIRV